MKRLATLLVAAGIVLGAIGNTGRAAFATPFSDVPANHWAYQYVQSLAADGIIDGYPDGKFKGDRPLTRYEMAVVVARAVAKLQENQSSVSKADLEKLQKLIDALKDELDALGVRVTNLEDSLDALDKRTKFAQSISLHGQILANPNQRIRTQIPQTIVNTTGATQNLYYGGSVANAKTGTPDPFVSAFLTTDDTNSPFTQAGPGIQLRYQDRFSLAYQVTDNLMVSFPVNLLSYGYGGAYVQQSSLSIEPGVDINLAHAGAIENLHLKFGILDDMKSSRLGLAFKAPAGDLASPLGEEPLQPWQRGLSVSGTVMGLTDFYLSFSRVAPTELNTLTGVFDPEALGTNTYFYPVVQPQGSYTQTLPNGPNTAYTSNTFNAGTAPLGQVFLPQKAQIGSVYVSQYNGATFDSNGNQTGGPKVNLPAAVFNDAYNSVIFNPALPAGSSITISYRAYGSTNNSTFQRYMINGRLNQKFKNYKGAEVGLTFNRIFDFDEQQTSGTLSQVFQQPVSGYGAVSDTVLGLDFQAPIPYNVFGPGSQPVIFGEVAGSKFTPDYRNVSAETDTAAIVGLRLKIHQADLSVQFQTIGVGYLDGAPFRYYGNPPALFTAYKGPYFPDFFGFANNVAINGQFDSTLNGFGTSNVSGNPNLTFASPVFNPFRGFGPTFFQGYAPNSRGVTITGNTPIQIGDLTFKTNGTFSHLEEITPNAFGTLTYGPGYSTNIPMKFDTVTIGTQVNLPAFRQNVNLSLAGTYENLRRNDQTAYQYYPYNPGSQSFDPSAYANANELFPNPVANPVLGNVSGSQVPFYPNFVNVKHFVYNAKLTIPLTTDVNLGLTYTGQRYSGEAGTTLSQNISEKKDFYTGSINYAIPKTNSTVGFTYRNYRYIDDVIPSYNFTQNREDVNFTIRF